MAEIIYRIPSRTVQYGYVEIKRNQSDDEPTNPEMLAAAYVNYVYAFQKEEQAATQRIADGLSASVSASQEYSEEGARRLLEEGLGGVTELPEETVTHVDTGLDYVENDDLYNEAAKPWDQKVDAKLKPWETENLPPEAVVTSPAVLDAVW